jgi:dihydrodipicolinate synthase/N-acetylneuraminate lyase
MSEAIPDWLTGVLPVVPTPFTPEDEVDYPSIPRLVDFAKRCGVRTVVTPAFGSEFYKLDAGERQRVIEAAVARAQPNGLRVVVQCNHTTPRLAARLAGEAKSLGASAVSTALPRAFAASENQLLDYARRVCDATDLPVIVQDWNPGGRTADAEFFIALHQHCANFRLAKLEEPGIGGTVGRIIEETSGAVGVLSGWGGSYAVQLHGAGICGLMPGLALADVFVRLWSQLNAGNIKAALDDFSWIAPYLQFSLQTFEQFHHAEKHVLWRRGALANPFVRPVTVELEANSRNYLELLTKKLLAHVEPVNGGANLNAPEATRK